MQRTTLTFFTLSFILFSGAQIAKAGQADRIQSTLPTGVETTQTEIPAPVRIDLSHCTVVSSSDSVDNFSSLRRKIEQGFNRSSQRMCTESIRFNAGSEFNIQAEDTYTIQTPADTDTNGDGWGLKIFGNGSDVVIDGALLEHDQCVFEVWNDDIQMSGLTIRVWDKDFAICDHGQGNDFSAVTIIETKPHLKLYKGNSQIPSHPVLP